MSGAGGRLNRRKDIGGARRLSVFLDRPSDTIMAGGIGNVNLSQYQIQREREREQKPYMNKPPYSIPSMTEIREIPWNGFNVVSTFSGCGGSCLGYRMAGFRILWSNEFVPAAQDSYRANHQSIMDGRDIRQIKPEEILEAIGMKSRGELDVFDGSPPCQAFSTAGKRDKGWGKEKQYEHGAKQCNETLFDEYIRLLRGLMPKVFIAENVSGLVKGTAKGYFKEILAGLKASGYNVKAQLLDAQWLGVAQMRQRIIFQGVRNDIEKEPAFPKPLPYRYSVRDALSGLTVIHDEGGKWSEGNITDRICPTVRAQCKNLFVEGANGFNGHKGKTVDSPACIVQAGRAVNLMIEPETDISRYAIGKEWDNLKEGEKSAKYFSCVKVDSNGPCNTITAAGACSSAAQPLHPIEKRKFTIAELRRICSFPDDFILTGSYAQQWERLGNSVPPIMMKAVAEVVRDKILEHS